MAITGPKYEQSAVDIISPMLNINRQLADENRQSYDRLMTGVKGMSEAAGGYLAYRKRKGAVQYVGDAKLAEMKSELAALQNELQGVENQMRTIKAEDIGSLDINQDAGFPAETDVNAWGVGGGRMTQYPVNTPFGTQDASMMKPGMKALGGI